MDQQAQYDIEYAYLMTATELQERLAHIRKPNAVKKNNALSILRQHSDLLLSEYHRTEQAALETYRARYNEMLLKKKAFDDKTCQYCGRKLRLINEQYYPLYRCSGFRDGGEHSSFPANYEEQFENMMIWVKVHIEMDWLTNILKTTGLKDRARASDLLAFYEEQGYDDLRPKYGWSSTERLITNLVRTKQASTQEEREIAAFLQDFFPKSVQQQGIRYKLRGQKETIAIIDLILSNPVTVYLLEIKRNPHNIHEPQLSLYQSLLRYIIDKAGDQRPIQPVYFV